MNEQAINDFSNKAKTFWAKPEGKVGMGFTAVILIALTYGFFSILPTLLVWAKNTLYFILILLAISTIIYLVFNSQVQLFVSTMFKLIMRKLTGALIKIDPIAIIKDYIRTLQKQAAEMEAQMGILKGQLRKLTDAITNNKKEVQNNLKLAGEAKEQNKAGLLILKSRKAGRLKDSTIEYEKIKVKMELLYRVLSKYKDNADLVIEDMIDQVKQEEIKYDTIKTSYSALSSAMSIIKGNGDKRALYEQSLEYIADDISMKTGEMERFLETSKNFMDSIDLQNGVFEEDGLKMLDDWEKNADTIFLTEDDKKSLINDSLLTQTGATIPGKLDTSKLFN